MSGCGMVALGNLTSDKKMIQESLKKVIFSLDHAHLLGNLKKEPENGETLKLQINAEPI